MKIKNTKIHSRKKIAIVALLLLLAVSVGLAAYLYAKNRSDSATTTPNIETTVGKKEANNKGTKNTTTGADKESEAAQDPYSPATPEQTVTPFISYFGPSNNQIEVNAYVPGTNEVGSCTLVVKDGSGATIHTDTKPAHPDAQTTRCENFLFEKTGANSNWSAVVSFKSASHSGNSKSAQYGQ